MQDKNRTFQVPPRAGDGTQPEAHAVPEANWYGAAQEPQEEYIENDPAPEDPHSPRARTSEGKPTFFGADAKRPDGTKNLPPHAKDAVVKRK